MPVGTEAVAVGIRRDRSCSRVGLWRARRSGRVAGTAVGPPLRPKTTRRDHDQDDCHQCEGEAPPPDRSSAHAPRAPGADGRPRATRSLRWLDGLLGGGTSGRPRGVDGHGRSEVAGTPQLWRVGSLQGCHLCCSGSSGASQGGNDTCGLKTCQRGRLPPSSPALEQGLTPEDPMDTLRLRRPERKGFVRQGRNRVRTSGGTDGRNAKR